MNFLFGRKYTPLNFLADLILLIALVILLFLFLLIFFYHTGTSTREMMYFKGQDLYLQAFDGHVYQANECKNASGDSQGNMISFTAIGFDLPAIGKTIFRPVIIWCDIGGNVDFFTPLPN